MRFARRPPPRIFVQLGHGPPAQQLETAAELFEQARYPERLRLAVALPEDPDAAAAFEGLAFAPEHVRVVPLRRGERGEQARSRSRVQERYRGEEYVLQIRSEARLGDRWDADIIELHKRCPSHRAVVTTPCAPFLRPRLLEQRWLYALGVDSFPAGGIPTIERRAIRMQRAPKAPLHGAFISHRFLFGPAAMLRDVRADPYLGGAPAELVEAVRLWTSGWDIYHPHELLVWHRETPEEGPPPSHPVWIARARHILGIDMARDPAVLFQISRRGLGRHRTLDAWARYAGIDLAAEAYTARAKDGRQYPVPPLASDPPAPTGPKKLADVRDRFKDRHA